MTGSDQWLAMAEEGSWNELWNALAEYYRSLAPAHFFLPTLVPPRGEEQREHYE